MKKKSDSLDVDSFLAKICSLKNSINYENNSIVSKTLINRSSGTITIFAFDGGQSLSEHVAPFDAFVNVIEGSVIITIEKEPFKVKAGEFLILPAGKIHALKAVSKLKMMLVMIK